MNNMRKQDPPEDPPENWKVVFDRMKEEPGVWFLLAEKEPFSLFPWWGPLLREDVPVETRIKRVPGSKLFGPRDVYARYNGKPGDVAELDRYPL